MSAIAIGAALKLAREEAGLSLNQAATQAGITKSFLWTTEDGRNRIGFDHVVKLCRLYGAALDSIARHVS